MSITSPTGDQLRVAPDQRVGLCASARVQRVPCGQERMIFTAMTLCRVSLGFSCRFEARSATTHVRLGEEPTIY